MMDDRLVPCPRSSASVNSIWSKATESLYPDGIICDTRDTPYGRQQRPRIPTQLLTIVSPTSPVPPPTPSPVPRINRQSREIERIILQDEMKFVEETRPTMADYRRLKDHLVTALRMNEVTSRALRLEMGDLRD